MGAGLGGHHTLLDDDTVAFDKMIADNGPARSGTFTF